MANGEKGFLIVRYAPGHALSAVSLDEIDGVNQQNSFLAKYEVLDEVWARYGIEAIERYNAEEEDWGIETRGEHFGDW